MNKYLEKIAARLNTTEALRQGVDIYQLREAAKKKRKKKTVKSATASRRWNRSSTRKQ